MDTPPLSVICPPAMAMYLHLVMANHQARVTCQQRVGRGARLTHARLLRGCLEIAFARVALRALVLSALMEER